MICMKIISRDYRLESGLYNTQGWSKPISVSPAVPLVKNKNAYLKYYTHEIFYNLTSIPTMRNKNRCSRRLWSLCCWQTRCRFWSSSQYCRCSCGRRWWCGWWNLGRCWRCRRRMRSCCHLCCCWVWRKCTVDKDFV